MLGTKLAEDFMIKVNRDFEVQVKVWGTRKQKLENIVQYKRYKRDLIICK